jgi:hypothetical protein
MANKHEKARELAEHGLDTVLEGDRKMGEDMIRKAKSLDPTAATEAGEEVEEERRRAEGFLERAKDTGSAKGK